MDSKSIRMVTYRKRADSIREKYGSTRDGEVDEREREKERERVREREREMSWEGEGE